MGVLLNRNSVLFNYIIIMDQSNNAVDLKSAVPTEKKLFIETYGCQMNVSDSEVVASIMQMAGYQITEHMDEADAIFVNTCSVRDNAEQKIYSRLQYFQSLRKKKKHLLVGVLGCMAERVKEDLLKNHGVNLVAGPDSYMDLPNLIGAAEQGEAAINVELSTQETYKDVMPLKLPGVHISGFVSIMRGCNNFCSYCIVPYVRGREKSRKPEEIICEIERLASDGVKEVMLLGQNVNSYGKGLEPHVDFASLLEKAAHVDGIERVRFMTSHPKDLSDELIEVMAKEPKVCRHLHLPLQSGSSRILKIMNRRYDKEKYLDLVERIRSRIPDISLTTDIIVGFPGETEEDFEETLDVVRKVGYDSAFTFIYSKRTGTPAAKMPDQIPEDVIKDRFDRLLALVKEKAYERCARFEGKVMPVLVESLNAQDPALVSGRLDSNLTVHFKGGMELIGKIVDVRLNECKGFYYLGELA